MRLRRIYIGDYGVLRHFTIFFGNKLPTGVGEDATYSLDLIVGLNGTGKSTLLQALAEIMRRVERNAPVPFEFELEYELQAESLQQIILTNRLPDHGEGWNHTVRAVVNGKPEELGRQVLPAQIVAFTSGSERGWLRHLDELTPEGGGDVSWVQTLGAKESSLRELPGKMVPQEEISIEESEESRFTFIRTSQLPLVSLCGLLVTMSHRTEAIRDVLEHAKIEGMRGFSLRFRLNEDAATSDEREAIKRLKVHATRALRMGSDRLLIFDLSQVGPDIATKLLEDFVGGLNLFRTLSRLQEPNDLGNRVLHEVSIFLERPVLVGGGEKPPLHLFDWLSDGEKSFLGRMCLFTLLEEMDSLVLLDEPEVHFNDYWKRQIVYLLDQVMKNQRSHVLVATHSSITLSDVTAKHIAVLDRSTTHTEDYHIAPIRTFAAEPGEILVEVLGARYAAGEKSVQEIERTIADKQIPSEIKRERLKRLLDEVSPGFWAYRLREALSALGDE